MSNPVTVERMYDAHRKANPSAELVGKMNDSLNSAVNKKGNLVFPNGIDMSDPSSLNQAQTFNQRKLVAKALIMGGQKKGEQASRDAFKIIQEETDPLLMNSPTYAVGNRLFTIDKNSGLYRPDLNSAFPYITTGTDMGLLFDPAPVEHAIPGFVKQFANRLNKNGELQPMGHKDLTATTPSVFVDYKYLTDLQKEGYKDGGSAERPPFHDFDQIMQRKEGGTVNTTFEQRLKSAIDQHMAGEVHMSKGGVLGAIAEGVGAVTKTLPKVDRLSMSYKDVTKRVPEVAEAAEKLFKGEITKQQYNDIVNLYKPVTPYSFVPKPATAEEAINALRGDAAKSRYGKQEEYPPGTKVGLRLDIPAYTQKGVWVNSIHDQKGKKVAYGPVSSVKNADLGISQNQSKKIALGGEKQSYARIVGDWNPMTEEEAVANAQKYLNDPEWKQIGIDPERHSYFYDRHTMAPITGADEVIQIGPLVLGKNPKYGKIDDFEYADGGYAYIPPFSKGGLSRHYADAGSVTAPTTQELESMADSQGAAFGMFPHMATKRWQQESPTMARASELLKAQAIKEWEQAGQPGGAKELALRIGAITSGQGGDLLNFAQTMIPSLHDKKPTSVLESDKPPPAPYRDVRELQPVPKFQMTGSADIKQSMREKGMINEDEYPLVELAGAIGTPMALSRAPKAIKGGLNATRSGLETANATVRNPFQPATLTMEQVAPDLGQLGGEKFKDLLTRRLTTNEGAPVSMSTMGGRKTDKTSGQGLYENKAKTFETNPMTGVNIPRAGNLSTNKKLLADIGTAGQELGQEMVAAHKFTPLLFGNPKDATAMMVRGADGAPLTQKQLIELAGELPGMIASHSPKAGGMFVAPYRGDALDYAKVQKAASKILGKDAQVKFGKADQDKDILYRGDYATMGARPPSAESIAMRNRLKKAEARIVRGPSKSQPASNTPPPSLTSTLRSAP